MWRPAGETEKWRRGILINANVLHSYQQIHPEVNAFARTSFWGRTNRTDCKYCPRKIWTRLFGTEPCLILPLEHGIPWQKEILAHLDIIFSLSQRYGKLGSYESTPVSYLSNADLTVDCFEMRVHEELTRIWQILYGNLSQQCREFQFLTKRPRSKFESRKC